MAVDLVADIEVLEFPDVAVAHGGTPLHAPTCPLCGQPNGCAAVAAGQSVWGSLTWILKSDFDSGRRTKYSLSMGTFYEGNHVALGSFPDSIQEDVDHIEIHASSLSVNLSGLQPHVERVVRSFELGIEEQAGNLPRHGSDILVVLTGTTENHLARPS